MTPFVTFFIAGRRRRGRHEFAAVGDALIDIAIGIGLGVAIGLGGALLFRAARARGWSGRSFVPLGVLGLALAAYAATVEAGGNGFVAAFLGGWRSGASRPQRMR